MRLSLIRLGQCFPKSGDLFYFGPQEKKDLQFLPEKCHLIHKNLYLCLITLLNVTIIIIIKQLQPLCKLSNCINNNYYVSNDAPNT
jgi:hypothetical protein